MGTTSVHSYLAPIVGGEACELRSAKAEVVQPAKADLTSDL